MKNTEKQEDKLFSEISELIDESKKAVAISVNMSLTTLNWNVGKQIREVILQNQRASYGKEVVKRLAQRLTQAKGKIWNNTRLWHCIKFVEIFPEEEKLSALRRELTWTHLKSLIYIKEELKREFYLEMCRHENWSTRILQEKIKSMLYERTALSKKPDKT